MRRSKRIYGPDKIAVLWAIDATNGLPKLPKTGQFDLTCEGWNNVQVEISPERFYADVDGQYSLVVERGCYREEGLGSNFHLMLLGAVLL